MLRGITSDYDYIRNTSYRDPNFVLKDMQFTMRRIYRRPVSHGQAKGRGTWGGYVSSPCLLRLQESLSVF